MLPGRDPDLAMEGEPSLGRGGDGGNMEDEMVMTAIIVAVVAGVGFLCGFGRHFIVFF